MNYWIFVVTTHKEDGKTYFPEEVFKQRMGDSFWGLGAKTPNRSSLEQNDKVVFYLGNPLKVFGGIALLSSPSIKLTEAQKKQYGHNMEFYSADYGVLLKDILIWETPKSVEALLPDLEFIENKKSWMTYFQGGVRQVTETDFNVIVGQPFPGKSRIEQIKNEYEFALEAQLEEFIHENWGKINWGSNLELIKTGEQDGRQFPAGPWSIDFLATEKSSKDFVVIELKRGQTSDSTVGQILRYIGWVKDNLAAANQNVRGIIIAKEIDDSLKYATKQIPIIQLKTYKVDFKLHAFEY